MEAEDRELARCALRKHEAEEAAVAEEEAEKKRQRKREEAMQRKKVGHTPAPPPS